MYEIGGNKNINIIKCKENIGERNIFEIVMRVKNHEFKIIFWQFIFYAFSPIHPSPEPIIKEHMRVW